MADNPTVGNYQTFDFIHVVKIRKGDTVGQYAKQSGSSMNEIKQNNNLDNKYNIYEGDVALVEFSPERRFEDIHYDDEHRVVCVYEVQRGDTITSIFDKNNIDYEEKYIYDLLNPENTNDGDLEVGEYLALPYRDLDLAVRERSCPSYVSYYDYEDYSDEVMDLIIKNRSSKLPNEPSTDYTPTQNMHIMLQNKDKNFPSIYSHSFPGRDDEYTLQMNDYEGFYHDGTNALDFDYLNEIFGMDVDLVRTQHDPSCREWHNNTDNKESDCGRQIYKFKKAPKYVHK